MNDERKGNNEFVYSISSSLDMLTELGNDYRNIFYGPEITSLFRNLLDNYDNSLIMKLVLLALSQVCFQNGTIKGELIDTPKERIYEEPSEERKQFMTFLREEKGKTDNDKDGEINFFQYSSNINDIINRRYKWIVEKIKYGTKEKHRKHVPYTTVLSNLGYYNTPKVELPWCDCFVDYLFLMTAGDLERAESLICQDGPRLHGAGSNYSAEYFKSRRQFHSADEEPIIGDQIFFYDADFSLVVHTGIVVGVDEEYVYTIEGNTLCDKFVEDLVHAQTGDYQYSEKNGYGVFLKRYSRDSNKIAGYGRPQYTEEEKMTPEGAKLVNNTIINMFNILVDGLRPKYPEFGLHSNYEKEGRTLLDSAKSLPNTILTKLNLFIEDSKTESSDSLEGRKQKFKKINDEINDLNMNNNQSEEYNNGHIMK